MQNNAERMDDMSDSGIRMVVFDWAGTVVDYGSSAPAQVFDQVFLGEGIPLTRQEINGPMGMEKKDHIRALLSLDRVRTAWKQKNGRDWTQDDVERLYEIFEKQLFDTVENRALPMPGVVETVAALRDQGLRIGSTTGYTAQMMTRVIPRAQEAGYHPDCIMTPDVAGHGRPHPDMIFRCMEQLEVYPPYHVVKVGDTVVDILEGKNAGVWTIGLLMGSNLLGLTEEEAKEIDPKDLEARKQVARQKYLDAGADLVLDWFTGLPAAISALESAIKEGRRP